MIKKSEGKCIGRVVIYSREFNSKLELGFRLKAALLIAPVIWDEFPKCVLRRKCEFLLHSINT